MSAFQNHKGMRVHTQTVRHPSRTSNINKTISGIIRQEEVYQQEPVTSIRISEERQTGQIERTRSDSLRLSDQRSHMRNAFKALGCRISVLAEHTQNQRIAPDSLECRSGLDYGEEIWTRISDLTTTAKTVGLWVVKLLWDFERNFNFRRWISIVGIWREKRSNQFKKEGRSQWETLTESLDSKNLERLSQATALMSINSESW